jgi:hypothetical protein
MRNEPWHSVSWFYVGVRKLTANVLQTVESGVNEPLFSAERNTATVSGYGRTVHDASCMLEEYLMKFFKKKTLTGLARICG